MNSTESNPRDILVFTIIAILIICFIVWLDKQFPEVPLKTCSDYNETTMKNVPAKCLKYFQEGKE